MTALGTWLLIAAVLLLARRSWRRNAAVIAGASVDRFDVYGTDDDAFDQDDPCLDPNEHVKIGCQVCTQALIIMRGLAALSPQDANRLSRAQNTIFAAVLRSDPGHVAQTCEAIWDTKTAKLWGTL